MLREPAWRGGPQARLSQLLRGCTITPENEPLARQVGSLCAEAGTSDVVNASAVVIATSTRAAIVTSDESDIRHLSSSVGGGLTVHEVQRNTGLS